MDERRNNKRKCLIYFLKVYDRSNNHFLGNLVDITTGGLMLMSESPIATDIVYQMKMTLPEKKSGISEISFDARSIRCKKERFPAFYYTGFQFEKVETDDIGIIQNLIEKYGISEIAE
ncbi:PilZ domain-containing protein [bacterium]|nr:PilZ domain-containing protein [bacterium]